MADAGLQPPPGAVYGSPPPGAYGPPPGAYGPPPGAYGAPPGAYDPYGGQVHVQINTTDGTPAPQPVGQPQSNIVVVHSGYPARVTNAACGLVLGILAILLFWPLSFCGLPISVVAFRQTAPDHPERCTAVAGITTNAIALGLWILLIIPIIVLAATGVLYGYGYYGYY
eukprot:TRINITY_DN173_c0_g1_i2.p1 TRINITY_DN173_c0_g1~~TRINITY_DN173_c0_g1_i2.p1  ORF type:complete len:179 (+),score=9.22 TRINITY_DN173_c0_g1_i2:32-538(+)